MIKVYRSEKKRIDIVVKEGEEVKHIAFHPTYIYTGVIGCEYTSERKSEQDAIEKHSGFSENRGDGLFWLHEKHGVEETADEVSVKTEDVKRIDLTEEVMENPKRGRKNKK